jgi:antitoxin (DNA-binding transcriptional repressor) of toxin-antitoxin stability system
MIGDHGTLAAMDTIAVSKFKATCLARLERVRQTGRPLLVTKRGVVIAQILPPPLPVPPRSGFGAMAGRATELADIVAPLDDDEWEALR